MLEWNPTLKSLPSLILARRSSIIFSVDLFDVNGLPIPISETHLWHTNCYVSNATVFASLWCPCGVFEKPSNHDLNNTVHSVYSPFRFYWIDVEIPSEKKFNVKNAQQPCWDEKQDWLTETVTCDIHWRSLHIYTSFTNAMQWNMIDDCRSRLSLKSQGWCCLPNHKYTVLHYHCFQMLFFI